MSDDKKTMERSHVISHSYADHDSAELAYGRLRARGYSDKDLHVIMSDKTRKHLMEKNPGREVELVKSNKALEGGGIGGAVGGAAGATILGIIAAGSSIAFPGIGLLIAGPLAGALAGGAVGATAGGLIGTLVGAGIPEESAKKYERDLNDGAIVVGVNPRDGDNAWLEQNWTTSNSPKI